ncbi:hypothetical protein BH11PLA2_BH11PLA2_49980 [soil metagenome]
MRNLVLSLVAVLGLSAVASAQWNGPPQGPPPGAGGGGGGNVYGWNPSLKINLLWWKKDSCKGGNCGGHPGNGYPGTPGAQMPGTLVFPQHQFVRSPRDYFMWEGNK